MSAPGSLTCDFVAFSGGQLVLFLHHYLPVRRPRHLRGRRARVPHAGDLVSTPSPSIPMLVADPQACSTRGAEGLP